uniref:Ig-like domain-containing protein n=1 Tax=Apteryx owenii TaxID=8824 RepID=A0A8B9P452_APTOW
MPWRRQAPPALTIPSRWAGDEEEEEEEEEEEGGAAPGSPHAVPGPPQTLAPSLPPGPLSLQLLRTSIIFGLGSSDTGGLALLGDVETSAMDQSTTLPTWLTRSRGRGPWRVSSTQPGVTSHLRLQARDASSAPAVPMVVQCSMGCQVGPNGSIYDAAYNGQDFMSYSMGNSSRACKRDEDLAWYVQMVLNHDEGTHDALTHLLNVTCIKILRRLAQHGREDVERQVKPVTVIFTRAPSPAHLLLVCHVTGFYPQPIHVNWLQDGQEVPPGPELNSTPTLPNADLTYQLRSVLAVAPHDGHSYACRMRHSSLGGRSLLVPWGRSGRQRKKKKSRECRMEEEKSGSRRRGTERGGRQGAGQAREMAWANLPA